jgi:hypothetical protein
MDPADVQAIHQLLAIYGHAIDDRDWDTLEALFLPDALFDASDCGSPVFNTANALRRDWETHYDHPLAHHSTNIVVLPDGKDRARVRSKGLGVGHKHRVGSVTYEDVVVKVGGEWKFAKRVAILRRSHQRPSEDAS